MQSDCIWMKGRMARDCTDTPYKIPFQVDLHFPSCIVHPLGNIPAPMGFLDVTCRKCEHEAFGVNSKKCEKCGSWDTHAVADEPEETWEDSGDDEDDDDGLDLEADEALEMDTDY